MKFTVECVGLGLAVASAVVVLRPAETRVLNTLSVVSIAIGSVEIRSKTREEGRMTETPLRGRLGQLPIERRRSQHRRGPGAGESGEKRRLACALVPMRLPLDCMLRIMIQKKLTSKPFSTFHFECTECQYSKGNENGGRVPRFLDAHGSNGDDSSSSNESLAGHLNSLNRLNTPVGVVPNLSKEGRWKVG